MGRCLVLQFELKKRRGRRVISFSAMLIFPWSDPSALWPLPQCGVGICVALFWLVREYWGGNLCRTAVVKQLIVGEPRVAWAYAEAFCWGSAVSSCNAVQLGCQKIRLVVVRV